MDRLSRFLLNLLQRIPKVEELSHDFYLVHLPVLLKGFARRLNQHSRHGTQGNVSALLHQNSRDIIKSTLHAASHVQASRSSDVQIAIENAKPKPPEGTHKGNERSGEQDRLVHEPLDKDVSQIIEQVSSIDFNAPLNPPEQGDVNPRIRASCASELESQVSVIEASQAYRWLQFSILKHVQLHIPSPNLMFDIGEMLRSKLSQIRSIRNLSPRQPQPSLDMYFHQEWNLRQFVTDQEYADTSPCALDHLLCVTGTRQHAQSTTVSQYMEQTWPESSRSMILLLNKFLLIQDSDSCDYTLSNGSTLKITQCGSRCSVRVSGSLDFVVEIGEQLGWLGSALRPSFLSERVVACSPRLSVLGFRVDATYKINAGCRIEYTLNEGPNSDHSLPGFCWANMFQNPVMVSGYPIRFRERSETGLELRLETMAELVQSRQFVKIDGNIMLKGFCSVLAVTAVAADVVRWHFLFNADGDRISYCDERLQEKGIKTPKSLKLRDLKTCRHVVGWCSPVREYTGHPGARIGVQASMLQLFPSSFVFEKLYLEGGLNLILGLPGHLASGTNRPA